MGWLKEGGTWRFQTKEARPWRGFPGNWKQEENLDEEQYGAEDGGYRLSGSSNMPKARASTEQEGEGPGKSLQWEDFDPPEGETRKQEWAFYQQRLLRLDGVGSRLAQI